jgi:hypothetical protein
MRSVRTGVAAAVLLVGAAALVVLTQAGGSSLPGGAIVFASYSEGSAEEPLGGTVQVWEVGRTRTLYTAPAGEVVEAGGIWLDGGRLAFLHGIVCQSCPPPEVVILDRSGAEEERLNAGEGRGARMLGLFRKARQTRSPDGKWDVFAHGAELRVAAVAGGNARTIARCPLRCVDPDWQR